MADHHQAKAAAKFVKHAMELTDVVVELYLGTVIKPFLSLHEKFYSALNATIRSFLDRNNIPGWFTANFITYLRTVFVIPCLMLLSWGQIILPSLIVLSVDFGDFLDGVVARYWVDEKKKHEELMAKKDDKDPSKRSRSVSPNPSDDDSYEVVTTGSPHSISSWTISQRNRSYGGFVDAVCDKAFVVPCWIFLLSSVPFSGHLRSVQYITLWCLILAETASGCIRFRAYFTACGVPSPSVEGFDFSTSAVKADHIGKAKQTFEMVGTTLFILPYARYLGLLLLTLAVPLAYESVRRKVKNRVIYVVSPKKTVMDHRTLKFWMQAKGMGSKLIVGVLGEKQTDTVLNACSTSCVDEVICEAPPKVDLMFLERQSIDYVVSLTGEPVTVTDEVIGANRCLTIGENGVARPVLPKETHKD